MRIREVKDETIVVGPTEPPEVEKMPSLGSEEEGAEEAAKKVVANGVAVLNGGGGVGEEHERLHRIGDGGEVRKTSVASSAGGTQGGSLIRLSNVSSSPQQVE